MMNHPALATDKHHHKSWIAGKVFCPNLFFKFSFRQCNFITSLQARPQALCEGDLEPSKTAFSDCREIPSVAQRLDFSSQLGKVDFIPHNFFSFLRHGFFLIFLFSPYDWMREFTAESEEATSIHYYLQSRFH